MNGIPFVVIECKRRDEKDAILAAIKQHRRNQEDAEIPHLYTFAPLLLALNKDAGKYATTGTPEKFWAEWKELVELKGLPAAHDGVWDMFRALPNKQDDEAYVLALEDPLKREEFYTRVSKFHRLLKLGLSTLAWLNTAEPTKVERYKRDAVLFQKIRASVKIRYAEGIDYRDYEKQIQKMLSTYVQADEVMQIVAPVNIFERDAFQAEVDKVTSPRAKAEVIANRTKKTITEKMQEDPFLYRKFSLLLQQAIDDYKNQRISEADLLSRVTDIMEQVRDGRRDDMPAAVRHSDLAQAFFGELKSQLADAPNPTRAAVGQVEEEQAPYGDEPVKPAPLAELLAAVAVDIERIIRLHAIVRWRENADAQNHMRNDLDDLLFTLQREKGVKLTFEQLDTLIEGILRIARNRTDV